VSTPGIEIKVEIEDEALQALLDQMASRGKNLRPLLKRYRVLMTRSFSLNFKNEGRPRKWKSLTPNTVAGRRKKSRRILQDTGRLRLSATSQSAPDNITQYRADALKMGTRMKIAPYHQYGTKPYTIVPKNRKALSFMTADGRIFTKRVRHPGLPARPFIMIQREDEEAMLKVALDYMTEE